MIDFFCKKILYVSNILHVCTRSKSHKTTAVPLWSGSSHDSNPIENVCNDPTDQCQHMYATELYNTVTCRGCHCDPTSGLMNKFCRSRCSSPSDPHSPGLAVKTTPN
jgi:hypothetical protein